VHNSRQVILSPKITIQVSQTTKEGAIIKIKPHVIWAKLKKAVW